MGLDMYLRAEKYLGGYDFSTDKTTCEEVSRLVGITPTPDSPNISVRVTIGYWRKANAIHAWFVDHVQDGRDECQESFVSRTQLEELRNQCNAILAGAVPAHEGLPSRSGFFFGSTEYDQGYEQDLRDTVDVVNAALALGDSANGFYYQASW